MFLESGGDSLALELQALCELLDMDPGNRTCTLGNSTPFWLICLFLEKALLTTEPSLQPCFQLFGTKFHSVPWVGLELAGIFLPQSLKY